MRTIILKESIDGMVFDHVIRNNESDMPAKHFHDNYEIYYLLKGECYYFIDKQTYHIKSGSLVLINSNQIHKTGNSGQFHHERILIEIYEKNLLHYLTLAGLRLEPLFSEFSGVIELEDVEQHFVEAILQKMATEICKKDAGYEFLIRSMLTELLLFVYRRMKNNYRPRTATISKTARHLKVSEIANYIEAHCNNSESLETIAKRFFISKCYLSRIFKEVTGFTINEYINTQRIKQAQTLLISTNYKITKISEMIGYESVTYFEKVFKRHTEISPLKFRKIKQS